MLAIVRSYGRLGNQLWTYANILAFAKEHNIRVFHQGFDHSLFDKNQNASAPLKIWRLIDINLRRIFINLIYRINLKVRLLPILNIGEDGLLHLDDQKNTSLLISKFKLVFLTGFYFSASKSLAKHSDYIKNFFSLNVRLQHEVHRLIKKARNNSEILIGVHIRHGDYRSYCDGIMYYTAEEYRDVMRAIAKDNYPTRVSFLICSDEIQDISIFHDLDVIQSNLKSHSIIDMYALGACDYIVGPNSSFSQWASFYGNVPLHVLNWKVAEKYGTNNVIHEPNIKRDFNCFSPERFGEFSVKRYQLTDFYHFSHADTAN